MRAHRLLYRAYGPDVTGPDREALAMYPPLPERETARLPQPQTLTELQRYGLDCVFCEKTLTAGDAVELGRQRYETVPGVKVAWYPRACTSCHTAKGGAA